MPPDSPTTSTSSFAERVFNCVRMVPHGRVTTYGAIARLLGAPGKAREVGWALHQCPADVPAHRVINRLGRVSGAPELTEAVARRSRLEAEGVRFDAAGRCDLGRYEWDPPG